MKTKEARAVCLELLSGYLESSVADWLLYKSHEALEAESSHTGENSH